MDCAACCCMIDGKEEYLRCAIDSCNKLYHFLCAGGRSLTESRNSWVCPECRCAAKKGGDNSLTPVGSAKKQLRDANVTHRKKVDSPCPADDSCIANTSELTTDEVLSLRQEMKALKGQLSHAVGVIISYESQMASYTSEVRDLNKKLATVVGAATVTTASEPRPSTPVNIIMASESPEISYPAQPKPKTSMATEVIMASKTVAQPHLEIPEKVLATPLIQTVDQPRPAMAVATLAIPTDHVPKSRKHQKKKVGNKIILEKQPESITAVREETISPANPSEPILDSDQWTEIKRRNRRPASLCGTAGPAKTTLKAVEPRKYIHLWNMESNVNDIRDYLCQLCPTETCTVQELTPRGDYKSYKIGVPTAAYDLCFSTEVWPVNARLKAWIPYQRPATANLEDIRKSTVTTCSNQPFRGAKPYQDR